MKPEAVMNALSTECEMKSDMKPNLKIPSVSRKTPVTSANAVAGPASSEVPCSPYPIKALFVIKLITAAGPTLLKKAQLFKHKRNKSYDLPPFL